MGFTPDHLLALDSEIHLPQNFDNALNNTGPHKGSDIVQANWIKKDVRLFTSLSTVTTTGTIEEVLKTFTMPADTLELFQEGIFIEAWGGFNVLNTSKVIRLKIGGIVLIVNTVTTNPAGIGYNIKAWLYNDNINSTPAKMRVCTEMRIGGQNPDILNQEITVDNTITQTIELTAQDGITGESFVKGMIITMRNGLEVGG